MIIIGPKTNMSVPPKIVLLAGNSGESLKELCYQESRFTFKVLASR